MHVHLRTHPSLENDMVLAPASTTAGMAALSQVRGLAALMAAGLLCPVAAQAQEVSTSGFASLVLGRTSGGCTSSTLAPAFSSNCTRYIADWGHAGVYDEDASVRPETRAGLQATVKFNPQLSATTQVTTRTAKDQALNLEWLYLSYQLSPSVTLQLGRKRLPLYYYSDFQDVGYAYNTVRPSPDVYGWDVVNYNGASLSHSMEVAGWSVRSEVMLGTEKSRKNPYSRLFYEEPKDVKWGGIGGTTVEVSKDWFTARFSYARSNFEQTDHATGVVEVAADGPKQDFIGLALNADLDDWTIRSELGQAKRESLGYKARFHLLTVGYRIGQFTVTGGLSGYDETAYDSAYNPLKLKSQLLALRYELHKGGALKLQIDKVKDNSAVTSVGNTRLISGAYDLVF
jgi:hypothetical protein